MKISVIIPLYNDRKNLIELLKHLNNQTINRNLFEVLVVNNDTFDLKINIKTNYKLSIINEKTAGSYAARNAGIKNSNNTIIAFTDSDMLPDINWLLTAYHYFVNDTNKQIGILTGPVPLFYKNPSKLTSAEVYEKYTGFDFAGYAKDGSCGAGNWFSYRDILVEFGGFRQDLKSNGDTELSLKISKKYKIIYTPNLINYHPARYNISDLVYRYRRILGGTYTRRFQNNKTNFFFHTMLFIFRRYKFLIKKIVTVPITESCAIFKVSNAITIGILKEYIILINGADTKR